MVGSGIIQQQITRSEIFSGAFDAPKKLNLGGRTLSDVVGVMVNGTDRSDFIVSVSENGVQLKGKAKKLGLKSGSNSIVVINSKAG